MKRKYPKAESKKLFVKVKAEFTIPFWTYGSKKLDDKAKAAIRKWMRFNLKEGWLSFVPLSIVNEDGRPREDCCQETIIKVKP